MTIEEVKKAISDKTGIPQSLLSGDTVEENIARAKALIAYKAQETQQPPQSTREQFETWVYGQSATATALDNIAEQAKKENVTNNAAPQIGRSTAEQFAEWFNSNL